MRLSFSSATPDDTPLTPWARRLRALNLPLLVRWHGKDSWRLGEFDQPRVILDVRDTAGAAALLSPSLDHLGQACV